MIDPDRLVEEDHPVRAIWDLLGRLDLSPFYEGIKAVEGRPGRDCSDPRVLIALWLYAISRGVREARALDEWAQYEPGCQWLLGLGRINYHTLSDFVTQYEAALDELFVQVLHMLMSEGLADLERVAHDGTKYPGLGGPCQLQAAGAIGRVSQAGRGALGGSETATGGGVECGPAQGAPAGGGGTPGADRAGGEGIEAAGRAADHPTEKG